MPKFIYIPASAPSFANIVHYYKFAGNAFDSVGSANGQQFNTSTVTGLIGNAFDFNGTTSILNLPENVQPATQFSVMLLIKLDNNTTEQRMLALNNNAGNNGTYLLIRANAGANGRISARCWDGSSSFINTDSYSPTNWFTVGVTATSGTNFKLYVNGVLIGTQTIGSFSNVNSGKFNYVGVARTGTSLYTNGIINALAILDVQSTDANMLAMSNRLLIDNQHLI